MTSSKSQEFVYCKHCSKEFVSEADAQTSIIGKGLMYTMIGPKEEIECDRNKDLVLPHLPKYKGCGKEAIVIYGWHTYEAEQQKQQEKKKKAKRIVMDDEDEEDNESEKTETEKQERGLKMRTSVRKFFMKHYNHEPLVVVSTKQLKFNTYIASYGTLTQDDMVHPHDEVSISLKKAEGVTAHGVIYPEGFKTVSSLKEYLFVTEILYKDCEYKTPLYNIDVHKLCQEDKLTYEFVARLPSPVREPAEAFVYFEKEHDVHVSAIARQTIVAIHYSSVKAVLIEHFLKGPISSSLRKLLTDCK